MESNLLEAIVDGRWNLSHIVGATVNKLWDPLNPRVTTAIRRGHYSRQVFMDALSNWLDEEASIGLDTNQAVYNICGLLKGKHRVGMAPLPADMKSRNTRSICQYSYIELICQFDH